VKDLARWAKRKAKKGKADFRYIEHGKTLEIAVVHEDGEWCVWVATVRDEDYGWAK